MNYDEFRNKFELHLHGVVYDVILNLYQYTDKESGSCCIKAEVWDPIDQTLKTFRAPAEECRFIPKNGVDGIFKKGGIRSATW